MSHPVRSLIVFLSAFACCAPARAADTNQASPLALQAELKDGSRIAIQPARPAVRIRTSFAEIAIPWASIRDARADDAGWELDLANGDRVQGSVADTALDGTWFAGRIGIPMIGLRAMRPSPRPPAVPNGGPSNPEPVQAVFSLKDGSTVKAVVATPRLMLRHETLGEVEIPIRRVLFADWTARPQRVGLDDGGLLVGLFKTELIKATSALGDLNLPAEQIVRFTVASSAAAGVLPRGLVAYYPMDEAGPEVRDASGNGNHGRAHGARQVPEGAVNGCFEFRGGSDEGDSIVIPHSASLVSMQQTRELTLCAWLRPRAIARDFPIILCKGGNQPPRCIGGYDFCLNASGDNDLLCTGDRMGYMTAGARGRLVNDRLNRWIHVAFALESKPDRTAFAFYIDGRPTPFEGVEGAASGLGANFDVSNDLYLGGPDPQHHPNRAFFDGWLDEVMIFNRRLSADEVRGIFELRRSPPPASNEDLPERPSSSRRAL